MSLQNVFRDNVLPLTTGGFFVSATSTLVTKIGLNICINNLVEDYFRAYNEETTFDASQCDSLLTAHNYSWLTTGVCVALIVGFGFYRGIIKNDSELNKNEPSDDTTMPKQSSFETNDCLEESTKSFHESDASIKAESEKAISSSCNNYTRDNEGYDYMKEWKQRSILVIEGTPSRSYPRVKKNHYQRTFN